MNYWEIKYACSIKKSSKNISVLLNLLNCQTDERLHFIQKNNTHNHTTFRRTSNLPQKGNVDFLQLNSRPTTPRPQIRLPNNVRYIYSEWHQGRTRRAALERKSARATSSLSTNTNWLKLTLEEWGIFSLIEPKLLRWTESQRNYSCETPLIEASEARLWGVKNWRGWTKYFSVSPFEK